MHIYLSIYKYNDRIAELQERETWWRRKKKEARREIEDCESESRGIREAAHTVRSRVLGSRTGSSSSEEGIILVKTNYGALSLVLRSSSLPLLSFSAYSAFIGSLLPNI